MSEQVGVIDEIAVERRRQIERKGWTQEHDDAHGDRSLALAAALYTTPIPLFTIKQGVNGVLWQDPWPWQTEAKFRGESFLTNDGDKRKKHGRRRRLVIAAALIVAEIERLDRASPREPK